jgi:ubiquinone/menaquinone biosynthesis C-methylase UbiE
MKLYGFKLIIQQKKYWEQQKKRRLPEHPVVEAFVNPKIKYMLNYINISKDTKMLDVGCGNGFFTYHFTKFIDTVGLDYSKYMLSINPCDTLVQSSALLLPFDNDTFDIVFCSNLLHHIEHPTSVINEMKRVSRQFVVLSEPNRNNPLMMLFSILVPEEHGTIKFSRRYMIKLVQLCDLKLIDSCSMGAIVPNKTPLLLLKYFKKLDFKNPLGFYNIIVTHK